MCLFGENNRQIICILSFNSETEVLLCAFPDCGRYDALTPDFPAFHIFERELYEEYGLLPVGHPWLKALRFPGEVAGQMYRYPFLESHSRSLHEVGVGPVHAGVIEPGHFRFICRGEKIEHLEIQLGYQHRGVIRMMMEGDIRSKICLAESIAGDSAIAHGLAYCLVVEALTDCHPNQTITRLIALEMERIAMHLSVLSALAGDVAYIMGQNLFAALRTMIINSTLSICGSRFGKRWLCPGGVNYSLDQKQIEVFTDTLSQCQVRIRNTTAGMLSTASVLSRFDNTGVITPTDVQRLGFTGIVAKSSGHMIDARKDFPIDEKFLFEPIIHNSGDVFARAWLRAAEIEQSINMILGWLPQVDMDSSLNMAIQEVQPNRLALSIVESHRGRLLHVCHTNHLGKVESYRVIDPSLHNWFALALAVRGEGISDFPLCNKSFDLSYCGSDL